MVKVKVIGPRAVAGVHRPGIVELDPAETNIGLLVKTRHVELVEDKPAPAAPAARAETDDDAPAPVKSRRSARG